MESKSRIFHITKETIEYPFDNFSKQLVEDILKYEIIIEQKKVYIQIIETGCGMTFVLLVVNLIKVRWGKVRRR